MHTFILRRILQTIPVLFGVTIAVFLVLQLMPGDPARIIADVEASREDVENVRVSLGLDQPIYVQYVNYISNVLSGNLGNSYRTGRPVIQEIGYGYGNTVVLGLAAAILAAVVGAILGVASAIRKGGFLDNAILTLSLAGLSTPTFFLGIILMLVFSVQLKLLPLSGIGGFSHLVLPAVTLALADTAIIARVMRSNLIDVLNQDYVRTARAKGLSEAVILTRHAIPNSLIPVVTVIALQMGILLGGAVVTETVFAWPGIGRLIVQSIDARDFPVIQASILLLAVTFVVLNLIADILYYLIDPRMKLK
ncbi:ABC transporter permease [Escherichia coli]|nr:ABC transporter permease [Salmonella enterica subsp. enterica serovar Virchow]EBW2353139.1 ABC transporter permease [Salmonella enterica subsp. enterica serovar Enteritidis]EFG2885565.1 ABC transporter permease [Escherichia coli]MIL08986.1 ABC transporter permease [Salmonella enterica subsp. enterica serovar Enteritidis]